LRFSGADPHAEG